MIAVTDANFEADVRRAKLPVLVDFWAPWCHPCFALARELETLAPLVEGKLLIAKANLAECRSLPKRLGVLFLPTLILFVGGNEVGRIPRVPSRGELTDLLARARVPGVLREKEDQHDGRYRRNR